MIINIQSMIKQLTAGGESYDMSSMISEPWNTVARLKCQILIHDGDFKGLTIEQSRLFMVADELCRIHKLEPNRDFSSIEELFEKVGYHENMAYPYPKIKSPNEIPQAGDSFEFSEKSLEYIQKEHKPNHAFALISGVRSSKSFSTIARLSTLLPLAKTSMSILIGGASYSTVRNIAFGVNGYQTMIPFGREKRIGSESSKFTFAGIMADENGNFSTSVEIVIANLANKASEKRVRGGTFHKVILEEFDLLDPLSCQTAIDRSISATGTDREIYVLANPVFYSPEHDKILQRFSGKDIEESTPDYTFLRLNMSDNMSMSSAEIEKVRLEMEKMGEAYLRQRFYGYRTKPAKTVIHAFDPESNVIREIPKNWQIVGLIGGVDDARAGDAFVINIGLICIDPTAPVGDRQKRLIQIGECYHRTNDFSNCGDHILNKHGRPIGLDRFDDVVQRRRVIDEVMSYTKQRVETALADRLGYTINAFTGQKQPKPIPCYPCYVDPSADDLYRLAGTYETVKGKNGNSFKGVSDSAGANRGTEFMFSWLNTALAQGQFLFLEDNAVLGMDRYKNYKVYQEMLSFVRDDFGQLIMKDRQGYRHYDHSASLRYFYFGFRDATRMSMSRDFWDMDEPIYHADVDDTPINQFSMRAEFERSIGM